MRDRRPPSRWPVVSTPLRDDLRWLEERRTALDRLEESADESAVMDPFPATVGGEDPRGLAT
jgi:hypothetical protein